MGGKFWENHFTEILLKAGFEKMMGWECLFFHRRLKLILSVYVDDFKLAGKKDSLANGWKLMRDHGLKLDPPTPFGDYLGCGQFGHTVAGDEVRRRLENRLPVALGDTEEVEKLTNTRHQTATSRGIRYDMFGFFQQCVDLYCELAGKEKHSSQEGRHSLARRPRDQAR